MNCFILVLVIIVLVVGVVGYFVTKSGTANGIVNLGKEAGPPTLIEVKQYCAAQLGLADTAPQYKIAGKSWTTDVKKIDAYGTEREYTMVLSLDPQKPAPTTLEWRFDKSEKGWFLNLMYPCTIPR